MKKIVFIVEDDPAHQKLLQVHFEEMLGNYEVKTFGNPEELTTHLHEKPFAIVLDHYLPDPEKNGLYYLKLIRKNSSIPVIYYTTATDETIKSEALKLGAEQFIHKDTASLVRLRTALDVLEEKKSKKGFFGKLFSK